MSLATLIPLPYRILAGALLLGALYAAHKTFVYIAVHEQAADDKAALDAANEAQRQADSQRDKLLGQLAAQDNPKVLDALKRLGAGIDTLRKQRDAGVVVKTVFPPGCKAPQNVVDEFNAR